MFVVIIVICLINLLSTVLYIISSFGNAILIQLSWQICGKINSLICSGNVVDAVFYISISTGISAPLQVYSMWSSINWPIAINLTINHCLDKPEYIIKMMVIYWGSAETHFAQC